MTGADVADVWCLLVGSVCVTLFSDVCPNKKARGDVCEVHNIVTCN